MHITLSPIRSDAPLTLYRKGDTLIVNGTELDLSPLPEGAILPRGAVDCPWLAGDITRQNGRLRLTLLLPHGARAPLDTLFPAALDPVPEGAVPLPRHSLPPEDAQ